MTPLEQFDIEDAARFEILARKLNLREELACGADEKGLVLNYVRERDARRDAARRDNLFAQLGAYFGAIGNDGVTGMPMRVSQEEICSDVTGIIKKHA